MAAANVQIPRHNVQLEIKGPPPPRTHAIRFDIVQTYTAFRVI
jgi:hypothetical protein